MRKNNLNICVDIDGTITSPCYFLPFLNDLLGTDVKEEEYFSTNWNLVFGEDKRELFEKFDEIYPQSYDQADLLKDADKTIKKLARTHNIYFVTARKDILRDRTQKWLNKHGLDGLDLYMLGHDNKSYMASKLECDIFIEDNPENAINLAEDGFKVILMDTMYNKEIKHPNITRVYSWEQIDKLISGSYIEKDLCI